MSNKEIAGALVLIAEKLDKLHDDLKTHHDIIDEKFIKFKKGGSLIIGGEDGGNLKIAGHEDGGNIFSSIGHAVHNVADTVRDVSDIARPLTEAAGSLEGGRVNKKQKQKPEQKQKQKPKPKHKPEPQPGDHETTTEHKIFKKEIIYS